MNPRCVIIGAGFAGAATAYHLAQKGWGGVLVLEQEERAGMHSSGRNAGMIRQVIPDPTLLPLAREGAKFLKDPPNAWRGLIRFDQNGSLLLGSGESWQRLVEEAGEASRAGIATEVWSPSRVLERVPILRGADFEGGVWSPDDGFVETTALLAGYLQMATGYGARVRFGSGVRRVRVDHRGVVGVETQSEFIPTEVVVNAAGAWAQEIGGLAGAGLSSFRPCRRHLFLSEELSWIDPKWPFVWDVTHQIYFRPDSGRLLLSPCDEEIAPPGIPEAEPDMAEVLFQKIERHLPALIGLPIERSWAGLRTLTSDGRFAIGWDPKVRGLFWVAGLGGHGVTTSHSVGAVAADMIMGIERAEGGAFSPLRFLDRH